MSNVSRSTSPHRTDHRTESQAVDARAAAGQAELLARGQRLLDRLAREAQAARAEARQAELEQLLDEARRGRSQPLQNWLAKFDSACTGPASVEAPAASNHATVGGQSLHAPEHAARQRPTAESCGKDTAGAVDGWQPFLAAAHQRLRARAKMLADGATLEEVLAREAAADCDDDGVAESPGGPRRSRAARQLRRVDPPQRGPAEQPTAARPDAAASHPRLTATTACATASPAAATGAQPPSGWRPARIGGLLASVCFHGLLVVVLALLTLQVPNPPASLVLETSATEVSPEVIEVSQPLDVAAPEPTTETLEPPQPSDALSVNLPSLESAVPSLPLSAATGTAAQVAEAVTMAGDLSGASSSSFFGAAASGNCFCYVLDSSSSMRGGAWEAAKRELWRSISSLKENQRFYILFFNSELQAISMPGEREPAGRALYAVPENLEHARRWIDSIRIAKGAPPLEALGFAIELEPDAIFLLTDGDTKSDVLGYLRAQNRVVDVINGEQVRVTIHAIAFYSDVGQALMRKIAAENRGQFIYVPDPAKR